MVSADKILRNIISRILRPLVRILLRNQVSVSEFIDQIKEVYVEVADKEFSIPTKKNTVSRISVVTGLSRKEVLRIKTRLETDQPEEMQYKLNKASSVIIGWLNDREFTNSSGKAIDLRLKGEGKTFDTLVKRYGGDITARAVLDELIRTGSAVKNPESGLLKLVSFGYIPEQKIEKLEIMSKCARDFFETVSYNLEHESHEAHFQRQLTYQELPISMVNAFKEFSKEKSLEHMFELNRWLAEHKKIALDSNTTDQNLYRVGLGIYYIQNSDNGD